MLGVRSAQRGLLEADHLYLDYVGLIPPARLFNHS